MRNKYNFHECTTQVELTSLIKEVHIELKDKYDIGGFILNYDDENKVIHRFNTYELLKNRYLTFEDFTNLHINRFNKLCDKHYCRIGLKMVQEGKGRILDSIFQATIPLTTVKDFYDYKDYTNCFLSRRKTKVFKIKDGNFTFDGLLVIIEKIDDYTGQPYPFRPKFVNSNGLDLVDETWMLRASACNEILNDKKFPIREQEEGKKFNLSICEYYLNGKSNEYIIGKLNISKEDLVKARASILYNARNHLPETISFKSAIQFYRDSSHF